MKPSWVTQVAGFLMLLAGLSGFVWDMTHLPFVAAEMYGEVGVALLGALVLVPTIPASIQSLVVVILPILRRDSGERKP